MRRVSLQVCVEERCEVETLALAISCLDRFLNVEAIHKCQLQLLATACLFLASKLRQNLQLKAIRLVGYTDNSITLDELMVLHFHALQVPAKLMN